MSAFRAVRRPDEGPHPQVPGPGRRPEDHGPPGRSQEKIPEELHHLAHGRRERRPFGEQPLRGQSPALRSGNGPALDRPELRCPDQPRQGTGDHVPKD